MMRGAMVGMIAYWLLFGSAQSSAEPRVLYDSGRTEAIAPYLAPLKPKTPASAPLPARPALDARAYGLPVSTPSMTPGRVQAGRLAALDGKMAGAQPLFLIGADQWSLQWLQRHRARLVELHAVGMIIAARDAAEVDILRQAAGDLPLIVASGEAFARELGFRHYPVLISPPGVIAQ